MKKAKRLILIAAFAFAVVLSPIGADSTAIVSANGGDPCAAC